MKDPNRRLAPDDRKKIINLHGRCFTYREIAHLMKCCTRTVARVIKAQDAEKREFMDLIELALHPIGFSTPG